MLSVFCLSMQCDLEPEGPVKNPASMDEFCKEKGFSGWFLTSAKDNVNVDEAARFLVKKVTIPFYSFVFHQVFQTFQKYLSFFSKTRPYTDVNLLAFKLT